MEYCKDYSEKGDENMKNFENITIKNKHGQELDFEVVTNYMDDNLREFLHGELAPCSPQYFYDSYVWLHLLEFGEEFLTEKENIVW